MEEMRAMRLPEGFLVNTTWIYDEVAAFPVVPPENIKKYWRVYTTTFQRLIDPTASRLENFWWHVWGSDRRELPGHVLARLFEEISNGPTFTKDHGPSNRHEIPSLSPASPQRPHPQQSASTQAVPVEKNDRSGVDSTENKEKIFSPTSASSKQTPGKPILKKPRGPSSSGPRPTARFVSPVGSDVEESGKDNSDGGSSQSTAVASGEESKVQRRASPATSKASDKKKSNPGALKKKSASFVASSGSKRRPVMPRRQSSQPPPTGAQEATPKGASSSGSRPPISSLPETKVAQESDQPILPPESEPGNALSEKERGKLPASGPLTPLTSINTISSNQPQPRKEPGRATMNETSELLNNKTPPVKSRPPVSNDNYRRDSASSEASSMQSEMDGQARHGKSSGVPFRVGSFASASSNTSRKSSRDLSLGRRAAPQALISTTTATIQPATAQGTINQFDENTAANEAITSTLRAQDEGVDPPTSRRASATSSLDSRLAPTQPSPKPSVPLGRSRSQLSMLLERNGDNKPRR